MSLDLPRLDDLTWEELRTAARDRIVAASERQWTLHAPVDPGVTLTELFAALLEERLFWMDQPDDARSRRLLALLDDQPGDAGPRPASCARTVLALTGDGNSVQTVAAGRVFKLKDAAPRSGVRFRTLAATAVLPFEPVTAAAKPRRGRTTSAPAPVRLSVNGTDRTGDLVAGRAVDLVPTDCQSKTTIEIHFRSAAQEIASGAGGEFGVLLELDEPPPADPRRPAASTQLAGEGVAVDAPANLTWEYSSAAGFNGFVSVQDGTGGFRRSGIVRLSVPSDVAWVGVPDSADAARYWFMLRIAVRGAEFATPPRLRQVVPNAVPAEHRYPASNPGGRIAWQEQARAWKPMAGNELALPRESDPPLFERAGVVLPERGGKSHSWRAVADLTTFGPGDRVFVVDRANRRLVFGDGRTGRVPRPDPARLDELRVTVDVGGGKGGNVGAGLDWVPDDSDAPKVEARNPIPGRGGAEEETVDEALRRAAADLLRSTRLCIRSDFENLAKATPGVAIGRAVVVRDSHPNFPCQPVPGSVTVYIVPAAPTLDSGAEPPATTALRPDRGTLRAVTEWLERARLIGQEVHVCTPRFAEVRVRVTLAGAVTDDTRKAVRRAVWGYLHPLFGGDDRAGWPAGAPLWPSTLLRVARNAVGAGVIVEAVAINRGTEPPDGCEPTRLDPGTLPDLVGIDIDTASRGGP